MPHGFTLGPNQDVLRAVPPLDPILYGRVSDWLDGSETWQLLPMVRDELPARLVGARDALDLLEAACSWMRGLPLERQVYAAMALVGRLDASRAGDGTSGAGASACHHALRIAHALQRNDLGIPELLAELAALGADDAETPKSGPQTGVPILTLHASKGLEWPAVFVVGVAAGRMPAPLRLDRAFDLEGLAQHVREGGLRTIAEAAAHYADEPESRRAVRFLEEERRLAYVGCTRAERHLTVTYAASYDRQETLASPFIADLQHAPEDTWQLDPESDAGVLLPLDVARSVRQEALAALSVSRRPVAPRIGTRVPSLKAMASETPWPLGTTSGDTPLDASAGDVVGTVLAAEWTAAQVAGGVPIRFRALPRPFTEQSNLRLSFSGLSDYENCPRKYFYSHVLHVPDPVRGASATLGSKLHSAIKCLNTVWMTRGTPPDDTEVQDAWRGVWPIDGKTIDASLADPNVRVPWQPGFSFARQTVQGWRRGAGYLRRYYFGERQMCNGGAVRVPVAIEEAFAFAYRGHTIDGRIDCVLRTPECDVVVDYKSGESSDLRAKKSLQLAIYERAWRERGESQAGRPLQVAYYLLGQRGDKPGDLKPWSSKQVEAEVQDETDREELWAGVDASLDGITGNRFGAAPADGSKTCAECAYRFWCPESLV